MKQGRGDADGIFLVLLDAVSPILESDGQIQQDCARAFGLVSGSDRVSIHCGRSREENGAGVAVFARESEQVS